MAFRLNPRIRLCRRIAVGLRTSVVCATLLLSLAAWSQSPSAGPYRVLTVEHLVLHDTVRNKELPLKIYYPDATGPFPVIIFSHGALASKDCYSELGKYWASFGYVSIHPSHDDSIADVGFQGTLLEAISNPAAWQNRPKDISFIIDSLSSLERLAPELQWQTRSQAHRCRGPLFLGQVLTRPELIGGVTITVPGHVPHPESFCQINGSRQPSCCCRAPQGEGPHGLDWLNRGTASLVCLMLLMYGSRVILERGVSRRFGVASLTASLSGHKYKGRSYGPGPTWASRLLHEPRS